MITVLTSCLLCTHQSSEQNDFTLNSNFILIKYTNIRLTLWAVFNICAIRYQRQNCHQERLHPIFCLLKVSVLRLQSMNARLTWRERVQILYFKQPNLHSQWRFACLYCTLAHSCVRISALNFSGPWGSQSMVWSGTQPCSFCSESSLPFPI